MSAAVATTRVRKPGPSLWLSIAFVAAGLGLGVPSFVAGIVPIIRTVTSVSPRIVVPGTGTLHLEKATYTVYEDRGGVSIGSSFSPDDSVTIVPEDVSVRGVGGAPPLTILDRGSATESLTEGGRRYVGAARFVTPVAGEYVITVRASTPTTVIVARSLTSTITSVVGWFALAGLGGLLFVTGVVLLIVGMVRRGRAARALAYAAHVGAVPVGAAPPGWHPDPWGSGRLRYWDGTRWTEHLH